jgi:hypothetical protein
LLLWALQRKLRLSLSLPHSFRPLRPYSLDDDDDEDDDDDDDEDDEDDDGDDDPGAGAVNAMMISAI